MKKIEKAKTVHYDFASFSQKNNVFIGYKNASITLCQNNQKIEGWSKAKSIWYKTFKSDENNNFYWPLEKNSIRIVLDLNFQKSMESTFMDVHHIPGEEIRDFVPLGELKMLIVSYNGVISITDSTEVVCQTNMHLTKDEVTKALALDKSKKYFCVSVKNSNPMVPSLRFYKINPDFRSFKFLGCIDYLDDDIIRNEYSYFFAINFEATVDDRPILTAFQCCNEFRVYAYYIDSNEKVKKIGYRKTESLKFVWDCKYHNGSVYALDRDLNLTTVSYQSVGLEQDISILA